MQRVRAETDTCALEYKSVCGCSMSLLDGLIRALLAIHQWVYIPLLHLGRFSNFANPQTVGSTLWMGDQPVAKPLPTQNSTNTE
jgi:hypothetical protein